MGSAREPGDSGAALPVPAFPIAYHDDQHLFPSLLPEIEARLPLESVCIRCPLSPSVPLQCSGLRLEFLPHNGPRGDGLLQAAAGSASSSTSSLSAPSVAMKAALASIAGVAAHVPIGGGTTAVAGTTVLSGASAGTGTSGDGASRPANEAHADRPFVYLQILHLEGMEDYKTHHRRMLKAWVDGLTEQHEEWLVLYVTPFTESDSQNKSFKKLLDKLRSDLNTQGSRSKERFLRLPTDATGKFTNCSAFQDLWNIFMIRLKETLVAAIETRYIQLEDDIQRHSQMQEPRFCPLFVAKENLALLHERCNRLEDALAVYDTMDLGSTSRHSSAVDIKQCHSLFISFGFETPEDEVPVFFDPVRLRLLQARVRNDTISYVQFRQYLFAKQADLLVRLRRAEEMSARGVEMTSSLHKEIVAEGFAVAGHVWAFLACVNLAHFIVTKSMVSPGCSSTVSSEGPSRASSQPSASRSPRAPSSMRSGLLPLKRPGFAVTRTLHRLTPPQFSLSPTRRQQAQRTSSQEGTGSSKSALSSPASPTLAGSKNRLSGGDGVPGEPGLETVRGHEAGGLGLPGTVPASQARNAAHLYAYGAQQLQRLIAWRERSRWSLPLLDFPLDASGDHSETRGSPGPFSGDIAAGEARKHEAEVRKNTEQGALDERNEPGEERASSRRDTPRPSRVASAVVLGEVEKMREETGDSTTQRETRGFVRSASSPSAGWVTPRTADEEGNAPPVSSFSLPWWLCTKGELLEELQRLSDAEELLVHVFVLAGQQYVACGYFRHAARLQFKLASAHFKRGDFEECRKSLAKMLPLFVKEPWTALWVQCQQLMAEADRGLGDADALSSSYFLSNVNAVPNPPFFSWRRSHALSASKYVSRKAETRARFPSSGEEREKREEGEADSGDDALHRVRDVSAAGAETESLLPPQVYLQRFVSLARSQAGLHCVLSDDGDGVERPSLSSGSLREMSSGETRRDASLPQLNPVGLPASAAPTSCLKSPSSSMEQLKDPKESGMDAVLERRRRGNRSLTRSATFMATAWLGPDVPELLRKEGQIYIRAAPNLFCWGALKPALVGLHSEHVREQVRRMRPALSLASLPQTGQLEAFLSSCQGLVPSYGPDDTPCTVPFVTPTAATSTHQGLSSRASGGFAAASNPFAAVLKASLDGRTVGSHNSFFHPTPRHLVRGAEASEEATDTLSTAFLSGSSIRGGAASVASHPGGVLGSVDQELLEQAVIRQLVDLIPLYRLPCHPELEPQNACLLAYATTLERVKPKSTAQVLGQLQQRRLLPVLSPSGGNASDSGGPAGGRGTRERDSWTSRDPRFEGGAGHAGGRASGDSTELDPKTKPFDPEAEEVVGSGPHTRRKTDGEDRQGRGESGGDGGRRETDMPPLPVDGGTTPRSATEAKAGEVGQNCHQGDTGQQVQAVSRRDSDEGVTTGPSGTPGSDAAPQAGSHAETLSVNEASARTRVGRSLQGDATPTGDLSSGANSVRSSGLSEPSSGAVSNRSGAQHLAPGVPASQSTPGQGATQKDSAGLERVGGGEEPQRALFSSSSSADLAVQFRVYGRGLSDSGGRDERSPKGDDAFKSEAGASPPREALPTGDPGVREETRGSAAAPERGEKSPSTRMRPQPLRESEVAPTAGSAASPHYRSSRALSVLQMGSLQAAVPSLSVSLGQCVELRLHIHSSLVGSVEADAVVLRLSQLPCAEFASGAGGSLGKSAPGSVAGSPSGGGGLFGGVPSRPHLDETHRPAPTSVWLVVGSSPSDERTAFGSGDDAPHRPWEEDDQGAESYSKEAARKAKLTLRPGMNSLSLFWSSRSQGVFVLEQVCVVVGAVVLVQWAGELPAPGMLDEVRQAMQDILLVSLEPSGDPRRDRDDSDDETGGTLRKRGAMLSSFSFLSGSISTRGNTKLHRIAPAAISGVKAALRDAAAESVSDEQGEQLEKDASEGAQRRTGEAVIASTTVEGDTAAGATWRHRRVSQRFSNPFFAFADWGNASAALAFEDRMAPQTPACLLPGYTPFAATLIHSEAPLERMLRPLSFEFRPPATAVRLDIQPAGPNTSFLFLNAKNYVKIRVDVLPGLLVFPQPARLRVLQCLLSATCAGSLLAEEEDLEDEDLASDAPGTLSGTAGSGRLGLQTRASGPCTQGALAEGSEAATGTARDSWEGPLGGGEGEDGARDGEPKGTWSWAASGRAPSTIALGSNSMATHLDDSSLRKPDQNSKRWPTRGSAVSFQKGLLSPSLSGSGEEGGLLWREGSTFGAGRGGTADWITPRSMATGSWEGDEQLFEGSAVQLNFCWEEAMATAVDDVPTHIQLQGGQGQDAPVVGKRREKWDSEAKNPEGRQGGGCPRWQTGGNRDDDASSGAGESGEGPPVLEQFDFIRIRAPADQDADVLAIVPRRRPLPRARGTGARDPAPRDSATSSRISEEDSFSSEDGSFEGTPKPLPLESGSAFASSQGWLDLPRFSRSVDVLVPVVPVHAMSVRTPTSFDRASRVAPSFSMMGQGEDVADETGRQRPDAASWLGEGQHSEEPQEGVTVSATALAPPGDSAESQASGAATAHGGAPSPDRAGALETDQEAGGSFSRLASSSGASFRDVLQPVKSRGSRTYGKQRSSLFRWRSGSAVSWQDNARHGKRESLEDRDTRLALYPSHSGTVRYGSASWGVVRRDDADPFPGSTEKEGSSLAVTEETAHVVASLQFYTSTGVDVRDRTLRRARRRQKVKQAKAVAERGRAGTTQDDTRGPQSEGSRENLERVPSGLDSDDSVPNSLLGYFVPSIYCRDDENGLCLSPSRSGMRVSGLRPAGFPAYMDCSPSAVDRGGAKRQGNSTGYESGRSSDMGILARPLSRFDRSISVTEGGIEGRRDLLAGEGLEEQFDSITYSMSSTNVYRERKEKSRHPLKSKTAKRVPQTAGETPLGDTRVASPSEKKERKDDSLDEKGRYRGVFSPCLFSTEEGEEDTSSTSEEDAEPFTSDPQPLTILRVQTSRVHRLQVRQALTHFCRTLHASGGTVLNQIFVQSCSPTEPMVLDYASISPVSAWENDREERSVETTLSEEAHRRRQSRRLDGIRVSLIVPSPLCPGFPSQLHCQDSDSVQLKTLLWGSQVTTLLVRLQHPRQDDGLDDSFGSRPQHLSSTGFSAPPSSVPQLLSADEADPSRAQSSGSHLPGPLSSESKDERRRQGTEQYRAQRAEGPSWRGEERETGAFSETRRHEQRLVTLHEQEERWAGQGERETSSSWQDEEPAVSLTPRFEPYLLSLYYHFLHPHCPDISAEDSPHPDDAPAFSASALGNLGGPASKPPPLALPSPWSETTSRLDENNTTLRPRNTDSQPLVYHIPLMLPVQKAPVEVTVLAPRTGRVSTPLFVSLVFTNCSDIRLDVRHSVSLEFDGAYSQRRQPFAGDPNSSSLSSAFSSSRSGLFADDSHSSHFPSGQRSVGSGSKGERGEKSEVLTKANTSGLPDGDRRRGTTGVSQTEGPGASPRLGECHDWLMVGSKSRTTVLPARSQTQVRFQLIPLRAGSLFLPVVRVYVRPTEALRSSGSLGGQAMSRRCSRNSLHTDNMPGDPSALPQLRRSDTPGSPKTKQASEMSSSASCHFSGTEESAGFRKFLTSADGGESYNGGWVTMPAGDSVTAGREVLVLPKVHSKPDLRLLP
ncbi:hypothetical protein TGME49_227610 [Toxoplasma gondii ME49]|uniref:TRAPPC10/Trs130 N-terminal domain-containing protein n=1 Tax=Toxoplasma gondii (strain ATCC 50611 / Me49) TaxID=508771 RepID=S8G6A7_TOXGM|nr:hypothetical protein TGME49_227610 [Toxoplasma gondii ME49]EPT27240.1 hypothetical protein TGME49_227610 [Toxoplasma gondii ME49]|eukprot:XP_018636072.1 hypothetical protein TGME49_227610 [Toxoplasma gondii ME49]